MDTEDRALPAYVDLQANPSSQVVGSRKRKQTHPDRISLSPASLAKLSLWIDQVHSQIRGVKLTRSQVVEWLIGSHEERLSANEIKKLEREHFDELKFAEWALRELKAARARGESISLSDLIASPKPTRPEKPTNLDPNSSSKSADQKSQKTNKNPEKSV